MFDFELVQDRDLRVPLGRHNLSERFKHNETEEKGLHGLEELRRYTSLMTQTQTDDKKNGKSQKSAGCTFVAKSRVRSLQYVWLIHQA